ncbi:MAG: hypothetical protein DRI84_07155 [Bacteroidetes bacterium]|nr:MAG: hypothetical protein DRI84_07155 [Bacteroidota bacterium]
MAFKIKPPYKIDTTPVYRREMENPTVHGVTLNTGCIILNDKLPIEKEENTISHEKVHTDQILRGDLCYDDKYIWWKGKRYSRSKIKEGAKNLPWEKEAYAKEKKV